jgi:hypothetical protein
VSSRAKPRDPGSFSTPAEAAPTTDQSPSTTLELHSVLVSFRAKRRTPVLIFPSPCQGEDEGEGPLSARSFARDLRFRSAFSHPRVILERSEESRILLLPWLISETLLPFRAAEAKISGSFFPLPKGINRMSKVKGRHQRQRA